MSRQDFQSIAEALKYAYLPAWDNQIGITPSAFIASIKKETLTGGKMIHAAAKVGISGGFGFGSEGNNNAPMAGHQRFDGFDIPICDMYTTIEISDKAIKLSQGEALANAFDTEMNAAYAAAEWNVGRSAFGDGTGKLCTISGGSGTTATANDITKLKEGLIVDIYSDDDDTDIETARIIAIDRTNKKITFSKAISTASGFLTVQKSFNKELIGLGAILSTTGEIYGKDRASNPYLIPHVDACGNEGVTDVVINRALRLAEREKNSKVNMLLCGDKAYDAYIQYLRATNQRNENNLTLEGGFKAIKHSYGATDVAVVSEGFVPENEIWGVNTDDFMFKKTEWDFVAKDGSAFERIGGSSNLQALLACYGNIVCSNPGGCIKLTNCDGKGA